MGCPPGYSCTDLDALKALVDQLERNLSAALETAAAEPYVRGDGRIEWRTRAASVRYPGPPA